MGQGRWRERTCVASPSAEYGLTSSAAPEAPTATSAARAEAHATKSTPTRMSGRHVTGGHFWGGRAGAGQIESPFRFPVHSLSTRTLYLCLASLQLRQALRHTYTVSGLLHPNIHTHLARGEARPTRVRHTSLARRASRAPVCALYFSSTYAAVTAALSAASLLSALSSRRRLISLLASRPAPLLLALLLSYMYSPSPLRSPPREAPLLAACSARRSTRRPRRRRER